MPDAISFPLVSIIIPTYDRANLIGETIQSVLQQTYSHWELIIIDDGSQDNTSDIVASFQDKRIRFIAMPHCGIFGKVRNEGLKIALGSYIAFLDSDDLWLPEKLEVQINLLQRHPQASFVFSNITIFGTRVYPSPPDYDELYVGRLLLVMLEEKRFVFYPSALLFKKEVKDKLGPMDDALPFGTDTKYFLNMCEHFDGIFINKRLTKIRRHEHSTSENYNSTAVFIDSMNILSTFYKSGSIAKRDYKRILGHYYYKMGLSELLSLKKPEGAFTSFLTCIRLTPLNWKSYFRLLQSFLFRLKS